MKLELKEDVHVVGSRPVHVHISPSTSERWRCNSPYCIDMEVEPPENGGPPIIIQGQEPWRGR
jgi:hypothetical protein